MNNIASRRGRNISLTLLCALTVSLPLATNASESPAADLPPDHAEARDKLITEQPGFIAARRDVLHRLHGMRHLEHRRYRAAAESFRIAARYADKLSQAAYAEMLWEGRPGIPQDRALAYAWMDLAAERGSRVLLIRRENYWNALNEAERSRALKIGQDVYAEYGDDVAKPRQEREMAKARRSSTGSRLGGDPGNLRIIPAKDLASLGSDLGKALASGGGISGHDYYSDRYWMPENHWARQDYELEVTLGGNPRPRVEVGEFEPIPSARPQKAADDSH